MNKDVVTVLVVQEDDELISVVYGPNLPFWVKRVRPTKPDISERIIKNDVLSLQASIRAPACDEELNFHLRAVVNFYLYIFL